MIARSFATCAVALTAFLLAFAACSAPASTASEVSATSTPAASATLSAPASSVAPATPVASAPSGSPYPSASPLAVAAPCTSAQVQASAVDSSAGLGTVGGWLRFLNASSEPCSLHGWPVLVGVTAAGATTVARQANALLTFPLITGVPTATLNPGDSAFAAYAGGDTPTGSTNTCPPSYRTLRVAPPGSTQPVSLSAWNAWFGHDLPACVGIEVTMVVPASSVSYLSPLRP